MLCESLDPNGATIGGGVDGRGFSDLLKLEKTVLSNRLYLLMTIGTYLWLNRIEKGD